MARKYYAEECPYGIRTLSDCDSCFVFESQMERDNFVSEDDMHRAAISRDNVRMRYDLSADEFDKPDYEWYNAVDGYPAKERY